MRFTRISRTLCMLVMFTLVGSAFVFADDFDKSEITPEEGRKLAQKYFPNDEVIKYMEEIENSGEKIVPKKRGELFWGALILQRGDTWDAQ